MARLRKSWEQDDSRVWLPNTRQRLSDQRLTINPKFVDVTLYLVSL